jgi:hypothetical protein
VRSHGGLHWKPSGARRASDPGIHIDKSVDRPSRRQRKSVSGFTMIRLSRRWSHQRENQIQNRDPIYGSKDDEYGCASAREFDLAARSIPATA